MAGERSGDPGRVAVFEEKTVSSSTIFTGRILTLKVDRVELPGGRVAEREVVVHPGAAAVVAVDDSGRALLVEQYRYPAGTTLLEIPAGKLDGSEEPVDCAKRELLEETGYSASSWKRIGSFFTSPGFSNEVIHVFLATGLRESAGLHPDADEVLRLKKAPLDRLRGMICSGEIRDAKTVASILLAIEELDGWGGIAGR